MSKETKENKKKIMIKRLACENSIYIGNLCVQRKTIIGTK